MTYDVLGPGALDYFPCQYGTSKLTFRGPRRDLEEPYVAFIGGTQTFGKFIQQPYPLKVEHMTGVPSVNFGQPNAGIDVFARDSVVIEASRAARVTVLEVLGAANMSNPLYTVHPRRNDRFLRASALLRHLYPEVDFSPFNFTHHMLRYLHKADAKRFVVVRKNLQRVWVRRMRQLVSKLGDNVILVRLGQGGGQGDWAAHAAKTPVFVTDAMIDTLRPHIAAFVDTPDTQDAAADPTQGMVFGMFDEDAAKSLLGPHIHEGTARALWPVINPLI